MSVNAARRLLVVSGIALFSTACTQLAFLAANVPASFGEYSRTRNVAYAAQEGASDDSHRTLDVYLPVQTQGAPVVIFFHGGGWNSGDKSEYKFVGAALAAQGYIAVVPNYRLYPQVKFPLFMQDAAQAVAWVQGHVAQWHADAQRVYLMGHSAGAHIAALLALNPVYLQQAGVDPQQLRGVIGLSGPYDFLPFKYDYMNDLFGPSTRYGESQPINYVSTDAPPMLLLQGLKDKVVAPSNTEHLSKALSAAGVPVTVKYFEHADHGDLVAALSIPARKRAPVLDEIQRFIDESSRNPLQASAGKGFR